MLYCVILSRYRGNIDISVMSTAVYPQLHQNRTVQYSTLILIMYTNDLNVCNVFYQLP